MNIESLRLEPRALRWQCDPQELGFATTDELDDLTEVLGQSRAVDAVEFGVGIRHDGYNLFVLGPPGLGKRSVVEQILARRVPNEATPCDWCYVNNFDDGHKPVALQLPSGRGRRFAADMEQLIDDLQTAIPAALELEEHRNQIEEIEQQAKEQYESAMQGIADKAREANIQLLRTPQGYAMAPLKEGEVISPEEFEKLPEAERTEMEGMVRKLQEELRDVVAEVPRWRKEAQDRIRKVNREATELAIADLVKRLRDAYQDVRAVLGYLERVAQDVVQEADRFMPADESDTSLVASLPIPAAEPGSAFARYQVNLVVDHSESNGAPIVYEDLPSYQNLFGRVEHEAQMGTLLTNFTLIKPGALHRANGGYLIIDMRRLLQQPFAWEGLKRALQSKQLKIESVGEMLNLVSTVVLEPEPIELNCKIILMGDRQLYYLLMNLEPDFGELFKVAADFDEIVDRDERHVRQYAQGIATIARREQLRPLDASGVAQTLEYGVRLAGDAAKLSTRIQLISDLLREADYWASREDVAVIGAAQIERARAKQVYRADRMRERVLEQIQRGTIFIDVVGAKVGQVNGLSVLDLGNFAFGQPSRITATTRLGKGEVVDIEREVRLGGAFHAKGVLILSSYLAARFARERPLSLSASLVFEQSYGTVDGDSASIAKLCALLSSLAEVPILQSRAVTGSVDQHGRVQPIGGVNEKIEGFFDVCRQDGLNGEQGVLIPAANVKHLMLRQDVVDAVEAGQFHIWAVETADQALSLLTGQEAGSEDAAGAFPEGSVNRRVADRLEELFAKRQQFGRLLSDGREAEKRDD